MNIEKTKKDSDETSIKKKTPGLYRATETNYEFLTRKLTRS